MLATALVGGMAHAATLTFDFDTIVTSSGNPNGPAPWATAVFTDTGLNQVDMVLTHHATSAAGQFLTNLKLNVTPNTSGFNTAVLSDANGAYNGFNYSPNGHNDAGSSYDLEVLFKNSAQNRLNPGSSITLRFTANSLSTSSFNSMSFGDEPQLALLHLQGIDGGGSAKLAPVPEPFSMVGLGVLALAGMRRKKKA